MRRFFATIALFVFCSLAVCGQQHNKYASSYNYQKAMEAIGNDDEKTAVESLQKEISEHRDNGYAYVLLAAVYLSREEYGNALTNVDLAIKYIPKKDKDYRSFAYYKRAGIHRAMENYELALADYSTSITLDPTDTKPYEERAQIYYEQEKYDLADKDYAQIKKN